MFDVTQLLNILSLGNPTVIDIHNTLSGISKLPAGEAQTLISSLTEDNVKKLALWSAKLIDVVNHVGIPIGAATLTRIFDPVISDDLFTTMNNVAVDATEITMDQLDDINNQMDLAIKADNWKQAIQVGVALAGLLPAGA